MIRKKSILWILLCVLLVMMPVNAKAASSKMKLNKTSATLYLGGTKTLQLKATVNGKSKKVTWSSSKKSVATVSSSGKVTAKKKGTAVIKAKWGKKTVFCKIVVKQYPAKRTTALEVYKKILEKGSFTMGSFYNCPILKFSVIDINKDGIPELMLVLDQGSVCHALLRFNGKAAVILRSNTYSFTRYSYYSKAKLLVEKWDRWGISSQCYFSLKKQELYGTAVYEHNENPDMLFYTSNKTNRYYVNKKETTKKVYDAYIKKTIGKEKAKSLIYYKNTSGNRKKYLK